MLGALSGMAAIASAFTLPWWIEARPLLCPLRELTGIPCPTCYGTRAVLALTAGDVRAALRYNPLVAASGLALLAWVPWSLVTGLFSRRRLRIGDVLARRAAWAGVAAVLANWGYLLLAHG